jgi:hypothetical protein
VILVQDLTD